MLFQLPGNKETRNGPDHDRLELKETDWVPKERETKARRTGTEKD